MTKPLQHSYSGLQTFDNCPEQFRQLYILKEFKKTYATAQDGIDAHRELERRVRYKQPLPEALAGAEPLVISFERAGTPEVEVSWAITKDLKPSGFWDGYIRGKYDVVLRWPEKRKAFIGDWKTGKLRESSDQLELGALLLMQNDLAIDTVIGANIWLQTNTVGTPYSFKRAGRGAHWGNWLRRAYAIERLNPEREWEKRESGLCAYCPVVSCRYYRGERK